MNATILCQSVCISDLIKQVWQKCQIIHKPTFLRSSLVRSSMTDTVQRVKKKKKIFYDTVQRVKKKKKKKKKDLQQQFCPLSNLTLVCFISTPLLRTEKCRIQLLLSVFVSIPLACICLVANNNLACIPVALFCCLIIGFSPMFSK